VNTTVGPVAGGGRVPGGASVDAGPLGALVLGALVLGALVPEELEQTMTQLQQAPDTLQFDAATFDGAAVVAFELELVGLALVQL